MQIIEKRWGFGGNFRAREAERKAKLGPPPLPSPRPRALTPPLPADDVPETSSLWSWLPLMRHAPVAQKTHSQSQSALLAQLPAEVRRIIWSYAVGRRLLHIVRLPTKLLAIECVEPMSPERETYHHACWGFHRSFRSPRLPGFYGGPLPQHPAQPADFAPLLQTCRMVYREAAPIMYSDNIFDVNHLDTLLYMRRSILSHRLAEIQSLNMTWDFFNSPSMGGPVDAWTLVCQLLAGLTSLKELTLHLLEVSPTRMIRGGRWGKPFEQLMDIKTPQRFDVFVSWPEEKWAEFHAQFLPDEEDDLLFQVLAEPAERPLIWKRINDGPLQA